MADRIFILNDGYVEQVGTPWNYTANQQTFLLLVSLALPR